MSLVAIKGQTRWSLLPLSGIKPYKQRSALVRAYVDLSISIVWRNARLCATINYRWQIQIRWIRIGWTAYFVDYRYRQLSSLSSRQSVRSLRPIETAMMNRVGRLIGWSRKVWTLRWNLRGGSGLLSSLNFTEDLWETMTWPRGIDKSRPTVIRQPRWHLEIWLELIFPRTGLESVWSDNYNHRFVLPLNEKKKGKK